MKISSLELFSFRNYKEESIHFHPFVNFFWGANGQGKTNLMEAIYFLSKNSSFRVNKRKTFEVLPFRKTQTDKNEKRSVLKEEGFFENTSENTGLKSSLKMCFEQEEKKYEIFWKFLQKRSSFFLNQKKVSPSSLSDKIPLLLFSPESLSVIKEGPFERRELLDEYLQSLSSENSYIYKQFKKALKTRNQVLKDQKEKKISLKATKDILISLNPSYLKLSSQISTLRIELLKALKNPLKEVFGRFFQDFQDPVIIEYFISSEKATHWTFSQVYDKLSCKLEERLERELEAGVSLVSPQKHDIVFFVNKEDSRYYCSQAQQRVLILSFKIAQALYYKERSEKYPILLLDDIFSELDEKRKKILIEFLRGYKGQLFLTGTNVEKVKSQFKEKKGKVFEIKEGKILTCQM